MYRYALGTLGLDPLLRTSSCNWQQSRGSDAEYYESVTDVRVGGYPGDDSRGELRLDGHGDVQWDDGDNHGLEHDPHYCDGTDGSDHGECSGNGERGK
jgi:hypothetical protein